MGSPFLEVSKKCVSVALEGVFIGEHGAAGLTASGLNSKENIFNVVDIWQKVKSLRCRRYCTSPMGLGMAEMLVRLLAILQQERFYISCGPKSSKCRALSLLCPLVPSNTWRVTVTWPTDWKDLWIINSWLIWLFWIGHLYWLLWFFSQRLESNTLE